VPNTIINGSGANPAGTRRLNAAMTTLRKQNLRSWVETFLLLLAGFGCLMLAKHFMGVSTRGLGAALIFLCPLAIFLTANFLRSKPKVIDDDKKLMSYEDFTKDAEAIVAPNYPELGVTKWLQMFLQEQTEYTAHVVVQIDEPHMTDHVYLAGPPLSASTKKKLRELNADFVKELPSKAAKSLFKNPPTCSVTEIQWD